MLRPNATSLDRPLHLCLVALIALTPSCLDADTSGETEAHASAPQAAPTKVAQTHAASAVQPTLAELLPADAELADWRRELLALAEDAARAMPEYPFIKDRSSNQLAVADACLELDQPRRALACIEGIDYWPRATGYARLAVFCTEHERLDSVERFCDLALETWKNADHDNRQDWQQDQVRSTVAVAYLQAGRAGDAAPHTMDLEASEVPRVVEAKASLFDRDELEERMAELEALPPSGNLDHILTAIAAVTELRDRGYDLEGWRERCEAWLESTSEKIPVQIRIEMHLELAAQSSAHDDPDEARARVRRARELLDGATWLPEDHVPILCKVVVGRWRAGEQDTARAEGKEALALFDANRERIENFWRGQSLRPLAESFAVMGDAELATSIYRRAVAEGAENVNARPRCDDLVATCLSMALQDVRPDDELLARMREVRAGLKEPW